MSIVIQYSLAALPSAQHRAGLAGLVLMVRWLQHVRSVKSEGEVTIDVTEDGATLSIDKPGLKRLLEEHFSTDLREVAHSKKKKDEAPLRVEEYEDTTSKTTKKRKKYIYNEPVIRACLVRDFEPPGEGGSRWTDLWRDFIWKTLRVIPKTKDPFLDFAKTGTLKDNFVKKFWKKLETPNKPTSFVSSTVFGAQKLTSDNVPFNDTCGQEFLLNFWPYVSFIYCPRVDPPNKEHCEYPGFVVAVPDVSSLKTFCDDIRYILTQRGIQHHPEVRHARPSESCIDLPVEGALDLSRRIRAYVAQKEGNRETSDLVSGYDVFHVESSGGQSLHIHAIFRLDPDSAIVDRYAQLRKTDLGSSTFRRQCLLNVMNGSAFWYQGFDHIIDTIPTEKILGPKQPRKFTPFQHDARIMFQREKDKGMPEAGTKKPISLEALIHQILEAYLNEKVRSKYSLEYKDVKDDNVKRKELNDRIREIAEKSYLAVRSRRLDADFTEFFAETFCSVRQWLPQDAFTLLTKALQDETTRVRTLVLVALSSFGSFHV